MLSKLRYQGECLTGASYVEARRLGRAGALRACICMHPLAMEIHGGHFLHGLYRVSLWTKVATIPDRDRGRILKRGREGSC